MKVVAVVAAAALCALCAVGCVLAAPTPSGFGAQFTAEVYATVNERSIHYTIEYDAAVPAYRLDSYGVPARSMFAPLRAAAEHAAVAHSDDNDALYTFIFRFDTGLEYWISPDSAADGLNCVVKHMHMWERLPVPLPGTGASYAFVANATCAAGPCAHWQFQSLFDTVDYYEADAPQRIVVADTSYYIAAYNGTAPERTRFSPPSDVHCEIGRALLKPVRIE